MPLLQGGGPPNLYPNLPKPPEKSHTKVFQHQKLVDIVASKGRCLAISEAWYFRVGFRSLGPRDCNSGFRAYKGCTGKVEGRYVPNASKP